jgi:hypothetical protein
MANTLAIGLRQPHQDLATALAAHGDLGQQEDAVSPRANRPQKLQKSVLFISHKLILMTNLLFGSVNTTQV